MYRLQNGNVIVSTEDESKRDKYIKQGYQLLAEPTADAVAEKTVDTATSKK